MAAESENARRPATWTWYVIGVFTALGVGFSAAAMNLHGRLPVGLASLVVGFALGLILSASAANTSPLSRRQLIVGTVAMALLTVVVTHAWLYLDFRNRWRASRAESPQVAMFRPETPWSPSEYLAHELTPGRAVLWGVDAVLVVAAAVGTVAVRRRHVTERPAEQAPPLNDLNPEP